MKSIIKLDILASLFAMALACISCDKQAENLINPQDDDQVVEENVVSKPEVSSTPTELPETRLSLSPEQMKNISPGNDFTFRFFEKAYSNPKSQDVGNMILSPISVQFVCGMLGNLIEDRTELCRMLGFEGNDIYDINNYFKTLIGDLVKENDASTLCLANALMKDTRAAAFPVDFIDVLKSYYSADYLEFEALSLDDLPVGKRPEDLWVKEKTLGMIDSAPQPILKEDYSLFNTICFKGDWVTKFDPSNTATHPFANYEEKTVNNVPMMNHTSVYPYYKNDDFRSVSLPMGDGSYYLTVILPQQYKSLKEIINKLDSNTWNTLRASLEDKKVKLGIPKFSTEYYNPYLFGLLDENFIKDYFTQVDKKLEEDFENTHWFNALIQKAVFRMDEDGASAAAVTQAHRLTSSGNAETIEEFIADHPFVYIISDAGSGLVLFMGTYSGKTAN